jgi:hypothetical protein
MSASAQACEAGTSERSASLARLPRTAVVAWVTVLRRRHHGHPVQTAAMVFLAEIGPWICALGYVPTRCELTQFLGQAPGLAQCPLNDGGCCRNGIGGRRAPQGREGGAWRCESHPACLFLLAGVQR